MSHPPHLQVLFLCTGNYYRSRFAELYFNYCAQRKNLPHRAFSRGLEAAAARNPGYISQHTVDYLTKLGIPLPEQFFLPVQLESADFLRAFHVIALDETEHRPMLVRDFPDMLDSVLFWSFPDVQFAEPATVLPALKRKIDFWINALKKERDLAEV